MNIKHAATELIHHLIVANDFKEIKLASLILNKILTYAELAELSIFAAEQNLMCLENYRYKDTVLATLAIAKKKLKNNLNISVVSKERLEVEKWSLNAINTSSTAAEYYSISCFKTAELAAIASVDAASYVSIFNTEDKTEDKNELRVHRISHKEHKDYSSFCALHSLNALREATGKYYAGCTRSMCADDVVNIAETAEKEMLLKIIKYGIELLN